MVILHVPTSWGQNQWHCLWNDHGTCVDADGLLHVESDVPQELSEEKQNDQIHPRLTRICAIKTWNNIFMVEETAIAQDNNHCIVIYWDQHDERLTDTHPHRCQWILYVVQDVFKHHWLKIYIINVRICWTYSPVQRTGRTWKVRWEKVKSRTEFFQTSKLPWDL